MKLFFESYFQGKVLLKDFSVKHHYYLFGYHCHFLKVHLHKPRNY